MRRAVFVGGLGDRLLRYRRSSLARVGSSRRRCRRAIPGLRVSRPSAARAGICLRLRMSSSAILGVLAAAAAAAGCFLMPRLGCSL